MSLIFKTDFGSDHVHGLIALVGAVIVYVIWLAIDKDSALNSMEGQPPRQWPKDSKGRSTNPKSVRSRLRRRRRKIEEKYGLKYGSMYYASEQEMDDFERLNKQ